MNIVGWLATMLNVAGLWLLPKRKYLAIVLYALSSTCFLAWGIYDHAWNVVVLQAVLLVLNIRTYIIWKGANDERRSRSCKTGGEGDRGEDLW